jgi:Holliday junction resolvase RusA-like endonuclease
MARGFVRLRSHDTDHPVGKWRERCAIAAMQAIRETGCVAVYPHNGPLYASFVFSFPRPKSLTWKTRPMPSLWKWYRPDTKNLIWSSEDAMKGILWEDDAQIAHEVIVKRTVSGDPSDQPGARVKVYRLSEEFAP